ncbi:lytic murein transglycosylase B [Paraglaciecola aquimarina]|uniref:Lytic murein transglycosylase B n=1 Tax=Paraglaciecola aquimarina TaxID=1235557 RepID=A0ABU3SZL9_9ALTE|nr:lytic murein transglycosylase B [Paraglaciecola aquimarina]MDU0355465.1 lytic murein transglycosylase B [Paraglaciecola aquimarina]
MKLVSFISVMFLSFSVSAAQSSPAELQQQFIETMVTKHNFDRDFVSQTIAKSKVNHKILSAIAKPWEAKPWHQYYPIFLTEKRLNKGLAFWQKHKQTLLKAERETGVPAQIIVAIIGVETFYGTYTGNYSVLDALTTLGFHYPPRATFFRSELAQLFLLAREENFDITALKGSYAGAMGWGQFISSSYRHYAVDFDGDGVRDLLNNPVDAIGSVANYFKKHGWKAGQDIAYQAEVSGNQYTKLLSKSLKYKHTWQQLENAGVQIPHQNINAQQSVKLLAFEQVNNQEYWLGLPNFYVITRYNHSPLYAMAVFQFSQQLKQAMN